MIEMDVNGTVKKRHLSCGFTVGRRWAVTEVFTRSADFLRTNCGPNHPLVTSAHGGRVPAVRHLHPHPPTARSVPVTTPAPGFDSPTRASNDLRVDPRPAD
jgi:hypothetical protein